MKVDGKNGNECEVGYRRSVCRQERQLWFLCFVIVVAAVGGVADRHTKEVQAERQDPLKSEQRHAVRIEKIRLAYRHGQQQNQRFDCNEEWATRAKQHFGSAAAASLNRIEEKNAQWRREADQQHLSRCRPTVARHECLLLLL